MDVNVIFHELFCVDRKIFHQTHLNAGCRIFSFLMYCNRPFKPGTENWIEMLKVYCRD